MKTEFLQNFKIGDQPMPKEVIDAILAENGRDIEAAKKPFADYEAIKDRLKTAEDGLKAFEGVDVSKLNEDFNPRTPCGVRRFKPDSPEWALLISIHAPRVGCDI